MKSKKSSFFKDKLLELRKLSQKLYLADKYPSIIKDVLVKSNAIWANAAGWKNKLIFHEIKTGVKLEYIHDPQNRFKTELSKGTNAYHLISYFVKHPHIPYSCDSLEKELNPQRASASSTSERRIRDTIQPIRKKLKLPKGVDIFLVEKKSFGLDCDVEIRQ
jgi:hypothetical protein